MKIDLTYRDRTEEIMDDLNCSGEVVYQTLRELEIINRLLGGDGATINGLDILLRKTKPSGLVTIADIGCGGGDMLKKIARWGTGKKMKLRLIGIDANPHIINFARSNTIGFPDVVLETSNVFSDSFRQKKFDVVVSTLFTHHFPDEQLISFIKGLKNQVHIGIVINDIHRHWFAFYSIRVLTALFSKSRMVKYDAPLSVLRAFKRSELESILNLAGISNYQLRWRWAFRWQVIIVQDSKLHLRENAQLGETLA